MALFAVTWFVYTDFFAQSGTGFWTVLFLQAVISVSVDMLPLPGGMGISETLFLNIFVPVFGSLLLPGMVLSRGLGYYGELLSVRFLHNGAVYDRTENEMKNKGSMNDRIL